MLFHVPHRVTPLLYFDLNGSPIEYIHEFNFLGLTLDSSLSFKFHLTKKGNKISRVIGLLHKLKHIFPSYLLRMIYNSLILSHMNYSLLACGANCHSIELLQKKTIVHIDGDTLSQFLTRFSKYLNLNLFNLIHFTVILMIATNVNFHDREVKSSMPYFGVFTSMFVHFHL